MYHIFLIIANMATQGQVANIKNQIAQEKIVHEKPAQNHNSKKVSNSQTVKIADQGGKDLVAQLKKEEEEKEKALRPDLESLGLDPIDTASAIQNIKTSKTKPASEEVVKSEKSANAIIVKNDQQGGLEAKLVQTNQLPDIKNDIKNKEPGKLTTQLINNNSNNVEQKIIDNSDDQKSSIIKAVEKPAQVIKDFFKKSPEEKSSEEKPLETIAEAAKPVNEKTVKAKKITKKQREKRIAVAENWQKNKVKKLEELRRKYLENNQDAYEEINRYSQLTKIIPQEKAPPKFISSNVPPPLLNRFRSQENKHHPMIMSSSEKIDFIFKSIAENRNDDFNSLLKLTENPNIKNSLGDTLLTFAILMRRQDMVLSLLSKGADPELANDLGYKPLNIAIEMADYNSAKNLIEMGADINFVDDLGRTYLMQAARVGSLQITDLLINKGVDINAADKNDITALAMAYKYKKDIIAKYLSKHGAKSFVEKDYSENQDSMVEELYNKWK